MEAQEFIKQAAQICEGSSKLAALLGVTPAAITQWCLPSSDKFYRQVPAERCPAIEQITRGIVRCENLRPDIAWGVLRGTESAAA